MDEPKLQFDNFIVIIAHVCIFILPLIRTMFDVNEILLFKYYILFELSTAHDKWFDAIIVYFLTVIFPKFEISRLTQNALFYFEQSHFTWFVNYYC
jgi:hypothetical protein